MFVGGGGAGSGGGGRRWWYGLTGNFESFSGNVAGRIRWWWLIQDLLIIMYNPLSAEDLLSSTSTMTSHPQYVSNAPNAWLLPTQFIQWWWWRRMERWILLVKMVKLDLVVEQVERSNIDCKCGNGVWSNILRLVDHMPHTFVVEEWTVHQKLVVVSGGYASATSGVDYMDLLMICGY